MNIRAIIGVPQSQTAPPYGSYPNPPYRLYPVPAPPDVVAQTWQAQVQAAGPESPPEPED